MTGRFFILRATKYSEADLILTGLDQGGGKVSFIARGALKSKKRFGGGVLEPTHYVEFRYRKPQSEGALNVIEEANLINGFDSIRSQYERLDCALTIMESALKVSQEGDQFSQTLFNLIGHSMQALESGRNPELVRLSFGLKLLYQQGVLNFQDWMGPFLQVKMAELESLESSFFQLEDLKREWALRELKTYLAHAEVGH